MGKIKFWLALAFASIASLTGGYLVYAQSAPSTNEGYTMFAVGSQVSFSVPFLENQNEAAMRWFDRVSPPSHGICYRYQFNSASSVDQGPFINARGANGKWEFNCVQSPGMVHGPIAAPVYCQDFGYRDSRCVRGTRASTELAGKPGCGEVQCGNPISPISGVKHQEFKDFEVPGSPWLNFTRYYNSAPAAIDSTRSEMGEKFTHSLRYRIFVSQYTDSLQLERPDGTIKKYTKSLGLKEGTDTGYLDYVIGSSGELTGYTYTSENGGVEAYDVNGRILNVAFPEGGGLSYFYVGQDQFPTSVADHFGRKIQFAYSGGLLVAVTTPSGAKYEYSYTPQYPPRLSNIKNPDGTAQNQYWDYYYFDKAESLTGQLTEVWDESNSYTQFTYDTFGLVTSSFKANNVNRFSVAYNSDGSSTVTTPLGAVQTYGSTTIKGKPVFTTVSTACPDGSCSGTSAATYDSLGNQTSFTGENGSKVCRVFDAPRKLVTKEVSGLQANADCDAALANPPSTARMSTVSWHPSVRKPLLASTPGITTAYTYDAQYRLIGMVMTPHAATATGAGQPRATTFTYNDAGRLTSIQGPRPGAVESFSYDGHGNMVTHKTAAGLVTGYGNHDGDGRPRSVQLPSGATAVLNYNTRGAMTSMSVEGDTVSFEFNPNGTIAKATSANGESLTYGYDAMKRVTSITNQRGQRIALTLNAAGLATETTVRQSNSSVIFSTTRVFDAIGRLRQISGAQAL